MLFTLIQTNQTSTNSQYYIHSEDALQIALELSESLLRKGSVNTKLLQALCRILFRATMYSTQLDIQLESIYGAEIDMDFNKDLSVVMEYKVYHSIHAVLRLLKQCSKGKAGSLTLTIPIIDILLEECLLLNSSPGIYYIIELMLNANLIPRTSTYNLLLQAYADHATDQTEHLHQLITEIMSSHHSSKPNMASYLALCQSAQHSVKRDFYMHLLYQPLLDHVNNKNQSSHLHDQEFIQDVLGKRSYHV